MTTTKADVMKWVNAQLAQDAELRRQVDERLAELRLEHQLTTLREARGLTQAQAARAVGVSQPAIAKLESGRSRNIGLRTLVRMVTALGGELEVQVKPHPGKIIGIRRAVPSHHRERPTPRSTIERVPRGKKRD
jgi:transcriptional regulator with XRE-family HTH domain